ncbi:hypothetical protein [Rubellicoccus peritrichatus]|uniref:PEP-CTERM protein-sorting domain-containing protein n=1 Tax=Rubellicoccus peritrichatus TaxID=3080537 RepID=A0AAQ3QSF3_9BACT|nr:hypothetical protein [Puniceicoccus sp. CR14]WOO42368.1 hypothetical protein RZN69_04650 [Puniceicoccus sp. CR14]
MNPTRLFFLLALTVCHYSNAAVSMHVDVNAEEVSFEGFTSGTPVDTGSDYEFSYEYNNWSSGSLALDINGAFEEDFSFASLSVDVNDSSDPSSGAILLFFSATDEITARTLVAASGASPISYASLSDDEKAVLAASIGNSFMLNNGSGYNSTITISAVPEPSIYATMLGFFTLFGVGAIRLRRSKIKH